MSFTGIGTIEVRRSTHNNTPVLQVIFSTDPGTLGVSKVFYAKPQLGGTWRILDQEGVRLSGDMYNRVVEAIRDFEKRQLSDAARQEFKDLEREFKHGSQTNVGQGIPER